MVQGDCLARDNKNVVKSEAFIVLGSTGAAAVSIAWKATGDKGEAASVEELGLGT